ncbi:MAG TPA: hypothetical protein VMV21_11035 [Vicinamibacteria bacterium]|nr:hypothetical protein [Vicinamibacteria bacterium]
MRNFGGILLLLGVIGFVYASTQLEKYDPVPDGKTVSEALQYPAGKWQTTRYGCAAAAGFGLLMVMYPKGR